MATMHRVAKFISNYSHVLHILSVILTEKILVYQFYIRKVFLQTFTCIVKNIPTISTDKRKSISKETDIFVFT